ncbi:hypothetical protein Leryth_000119 [Lithospermum erythrorhizon]|nr:hypothetical protein Leryth_000119 [Lithospermum erythrorhizon]
MESFTLRFGLMSEFPEHLRRWLNCIIRLGVRKLDLNFCCNDELLKIPQSKLIVFPFKVLLSSFVLEYVQLSHCILQSNFLGTSNSLKELTLDFVPLVNGEVESILSSCPQLRLLDLKYFCEQVREIGFSAPNLDFFDYYGNCALSFFPSYVPNLRRLYLDFKYHNGPPHGVGCFIHSAPCLNALWIQAFPYQVRHIQTEMPTLWNLHTLALHVIKGSLDLRDIISLIAVCPNLSKFELSTPVCSLSYTERDEEVLPTCDHLKLVVLDGFKFDAAQKKFVSQLIRCAPALQEMNLYTAYFLYHLGEKVEKTLPLERRVFSHQLISRTKQQLQHQASSSSVIVNISRGN